MTKIDMDEIRAKLASIKDDEDALVAFISGILKSPKKPKKEIDEIFWHSKPGTIVHLTPADVERLAELSEDWTLLCGHCGNEVDLIPIRIQGGTYYWCPLCHFLAGISRAPCCGAWSHHGVCWIDHVAERIEKASKQLDGLDNKAAIAYIKTRIDDDISKPWLRAFLDALSRRF